MRRLTSYENGLVLMMSLCNGVVALDRSATSFLAPWIVDEFGISNTQLGLLASGLSVAVAASAYLLSSLADATRRRKQILLVMLVLFSLCSALSGLATGFGLLLAARILLGLTEGPIAPIAQSVVAIESTERRRGLNMGIMLNLGAALLGIGVGPIVATQVATAFGWRAAFFVSCVPGLLLALAVWRWMRPVREAAPGAAAPGLSGGGMWAVLRTRNILLCILISGLFSGWLLIQGVFLPLYLVRIDGLQPTQMGWVVSVTGVASALGGMVAPAISDRLGRRPVLAAICAFGVLSPAAVLLVHGSPWMIAAALFVGGLGAGAGPLYIGIVPAESAPARYVAAAVAVSMTSGELIGGVLGPAVAGRAADLFGLGAPFWICAAAAAVCSVLSLFLVETAPSRRAASA